MAQLPYNAGQPVPWCFGTGVTQYVRMDMTYFTDRHARHHGLKDQGYTTVFARRIINHSLSVGRFVAPLNTVFVQGSFAADWVLCLDSNTLVVRGEGGSRG